VTDSSSNRVLPYTGFDRLPVEIDSPLAAQIRDQVQSASGGPVEMAVTARLVLYGDTSSTGTYIALRTPALPTPPPRWDDGLIESPRRNWWEFWR
jgi:hypothetical protein